MHVPFYIFIRLQHFTETNDAAEDNHSPLVKSPPKNKQKPDIPSQKPDVPSQNSDVPSQKPDEPSQNPDVPSQKPDVPSQKQDKPTRPVTTPPNTKDPCKSPPRKKQKSRTLYR